MKNFLALYMGDPAAVGQPMPPPNEEMLTKGLAAWHKWMADHGASVVVQGGPLGKTKRTSKDGVADIRNAVGGFIVVEAESHEAAAKMFENHPHFMIFPGVAVETMEVMAIPGG